MQKTFSCATVKTAANVEDSAKGQAWATEFTSTNQPFNKWTRPVPQSFP